MVSPSVPSRALAQQAEIIGPKKCGALFLTALSLTSPPGGLWAGPICAKQGEGERKKDDNL